MNTLILIATSLCFITSAAASNHAVHLDQIPIIKATCTVNSGAQGQCMPVADCQAQGGTPEPGKMQHK